MTPALLAKIKRLADDPNCDPMTRKIAQAQLDFHNGVAPPGIHPGLRQTPEHQAWMKQVKAGDLGKRR
jgi:hypothetical protein